MEHTENDKLDALYVSLSHDTKERVDSLIYVREVNCAREINVRKQIEAAVECTRMDYHKGADRNDYELRFMGREKLLNELQRTETSFLDKKKNKEPGHEVEILFIAEVYPPSVTPLAGLKAIVLQQFKIGSHHRGKFAILRVIAAGIRMANQTVGCAIEDQLGACMAVILFHQNPHRLAMDILEMGNVIIIKEPFVKSDQDGYAQIQINHWSDVVFLEEDDRRFPKKWCSQKTKTAEQWKEEGNKLMQKDGMDYYGAIKAYTKALNASPTLEQEKAIRNNRALANLQIEAYDKVLEDTSFVADPMLRSQNALLREAAAYYGLGKFKECLKILEIALEKYPSKVTKLEIKRVKLRLKEEQKDYKWATMRKLAEEKPPFIDCANFQGPVEVRPCAYGRGMFTTRPVNVGEVLLVEKAFVYCFRDGFDEYTGKHQSGLSTLVNLNESEMMVFGLGSIFTETLSKLEGNPSLVPKFFDQYHGSYQPAAVAEVDGRSVLDTFHIERIIKLNSFANPVIDKAVPVASDTSSTYFGDPEATIGGYSRGIWPLAAQINHACMATSCRTFIGDVQIVRACKDLPANTEITFWYQPPGETKVTQKRLEDFWGFTCECAYCKDNEETPTLNKEKRVELVELLRGKNIAEHAAARAQGRKNDGIAATTAEQKEVVKRWEELEGTYISPASDIPRKDVFDLEFMVVWWLLKVDELDGMIYHGLSCLSSLGFVIDVSASKDNNESTLKVKQWGLPLKAALGVWVALWSAWGALGEPGLELKARELAVKFCEIVVGEKETFGEKFGWLHEQTAKNHKH